MAVNRPAPTDSIPPLTWGVWIYNYGWLRDEHGKIFADPRIQYAKTALRMWKIGDDTPARIELIDDSMIGMQSIFIEREHKQELNRSMNRSFKSRLRRFIYGLLG